DALKKGGGILEREFLFSLARKAFVCTARYDGEIGQHLSRIGSDSDFPPNVFMDFEKISDLRYGENPHQRASFYRWGGQVPHGLASARQLQGKELSYNIIVDLQAAWDLIYEFGDRACGIIKHKNPCETAIGNSCRYAYHK